MIGMVPHWIDGLVHGCATLCHTCFYPLTRRPGCHAYSSALQSVVETQVYPNVATGFSDSNAYLRELTLKSMLVLAPKLSQKTLNQSLLKFLAKLQVSPPSHVYPPILRFQQLLWCYLCSLAHRIVLCEG